MSKSISIPIALSGLKRFSFRRFSSNKNRDNSTALNGFVITVTKSITGSIKLFGLPAERAGVCVGDEIVAINDVEIEGKTHDEVVRYLKECIRSRTIHLKIRRRTADPTQQSTSFEPQVTEAFLVSVDRNKIKNVTNRLKNILYWRGKSIRIIFIYTSINTLE
ncbi:PDZ/DHR/GLGF domain protein [Dictyocaulus viviparus]|uniref:PDZ/DHR/GLGF domain protein n=1 Tax=Dictyocaulus viviparus TaxID=29172 RepID=A0A0D8YGA6_DICVI|nr:PDZ/DHR/GLGF domain protein [Dictyocaulus viviparus]